MKLVAWMLIALTFCLACTKEQAIQVADATIDATVASNNAMVAALQKVHDRARADREAAMIAIAQTATSREQGKAAIDKVDAGYAAAFEMFATAEKLQNGLAEALEAAQAAIELGKVPDVDKVLALAAELQQTHAAVLAALNELR